MSKKNTKNSALGIYERPVELLQRLITFDTTNPPGNEAPCIAYIDDLLRQAGIETTILAREDDPQRPNLVARLKGRGSAPPLLLYGHVDVVSTANQHWQVPPFAGQVVNDFVWGRGALDMKGGVAMMLSAFLRAKAQAVDLPGDVILCILSDEENAGKYGARFLVEKHASLFKGTRYAIGEFGGFSYYIKNKKFYLIQVAEKQACCFKAIIRGPGGHGAMVMRGGAMARLARLLQKLDNQYLPVHITPAARLMFSTIAKHLPFPAGYLMKQLLNPRRTNSILDKLGEAGRAFAPLFHHTANATIVRGGDKINVIPSEIEVKMDVRLLPGFSPEEARLELREYLGDDIALEMEFYQPGSGQPKMGLFPTLAGILEQADPQGIPAPLLISGTTDARYFARLGIQTYGFTPMQLPPDFNFLRLLHGADERIPAAALEFGSNAIYQVLQRFHD